LLEYILYSAHHHLPNTPPPPIFMLEIYPTRNIPARKKKIYEQPLTEYIEKATMTHNPPPPTSRSITRCLLFQLLIKIVYTCSLRDDIIKFNRLLERRNKKYRHFTV
jgi:hypothetical protein